VIINFIKQNNLVVIKRVKFEKGEQKIFISTATNNLSLKKFCETYGQTINLNYSSFKDYFQERKTLPMTVFQLLCEYSNIDTSKYNYKIIPANWWQSSAGKKGIKCMLKKYDIKTINNWRTQGFKKSNIAGGNIKKVSIPETVDGEIAELFGTILGDGTLTRYFIRISGDKRFDLPYFQYLTGLVQKKFNISPDIRIEPFANQLYLEIRSKNICGYFQKELEFKIGNKIKNKTKMPPIIKESKENFFPCLRGLIDTDGSVSKDGGILSIRFSSHNPSLLNQLKENSFLNDIFTIKSSKTETGTRSFEKIKKYFDCVGSSNLRHIIRYKEYLKGNLLNKKDVLKYYQKYSKLSLPFKTN